MKKLSFILWVSILLAACSKEDYPKYDTAQKDGVYIEHYVQQLGSDTKEIVDSIFYNFGFESITEYTINIRVALMGVPKDYDRKVSVVSDPQKNANVDFTAAKQQYFTVPTNVTLPAGTIETVIPVTLKRDAELSSVRSSLTIEVVANDDLEVRGNSQFIVTFDDKMPTTPKWWTTYNLGAFNKTKGQLFFKYFWEMENENKYIFDKIVARWGRNLNIGPFTPGYANSPIVVYSFAFNSIVIMRMWEDLQADPTNPDLQGIAKPTLY